MPVSTVIGLAEDPDLDTNWQPVGWGLPGEEISKSSLGGGGYMYLNISALGLKNIIELMTFNA